MTISATTNTVNGLLRVQGNDARKFLQGQLTCDIDQLDQLKSLPGAYCSPQGRVRGNFIIFEQAQDNFLMLMPKIQVIFFIEAMAPYVAFFQCTMTDSSDNWQIFGLQSDEVSLNNFPPLSQTTWSVSSSEKIHCIKFPGSESRWLCLSQQSSQKFIADFSSMAINEWQIQNMYSGLVWIDETNRDNFLPHDLSLPNFGAVSFTKGCYTGQEIVARMQYRGDPKYLLAIISTESMTNKISDKLVQLIDNKEEKMIGTAIQQLQLDDNSWLILASVKRTLLSQQQFQLSSNEKSILCIITTPNTVKESNES
ncbi:MAG: folate-binding protein YgfZ [Gammaproteobacteria bacterium]|nr:folate-binding protein YgfZ [Gammaproteobacteria bacterium]